MSTGETSPKPSSGPCRGIAGRLIEAYAGVVASYEGASLEEFARQGFLAQRAAEASAAGQDAEEALQEEGCSYGEALARVIAGGDRMVAVGAGAVAAKGMLLAQANNAYFYGPGGAARPPEDVLVPREPAVDVTDEVASLEVSAEDSCAELGKARALLVQAGLNAVTLNPTSETFDDQTTEKGRAVTAAENRSGCSRYELSRALLEALDGVEAVGFAANSRYGEVVKDAWLDVQDRLVEIELDVSVTAHPKDGTVGDAVRIDYAVENEGTVPLGGVQLQDVDGKAVDDPIPLLAPRSTQLISEIVELTEDDVPRREVGVQVTASGPFGRQTGVGYTTIFVRVRPK